MSDLTPAIAEAFFSGAALGHLTTINPDGSPHTTIVWVAVDDGDVVCAHLSDGYRKLRNVARDARVSVSVELSTTSAQGLRHYVVVEGAAKLHGGGGAALLQELAHRHLGPDVVFPGPDAPDGFVLRTTPTRVRGVYPD
ncbi:MAG: TIGR03618 family F420-dependent PPOX class oxidoreductase [Sporichthyaceae bacterium]